jgi:hypothetical protein
MRMPDDDPSEYPVMVTLRIRATDAMEASSAVFVAIRALHRERVEVYSHGRAKHNVAGWGVFVNVDDDDDMSSFVAEEWKR